MKMKINRVKAKEKLKTCTREDLEWLMNAVQIELSENHMEVMSNTTHTPREQNESLHRMVAQAWIHG